MTKEKLFSEIAFLLDVDVSEVNEETNFRSFSSYSSLVAIGIVSMLEENLHVSIDIFQLKDLKSVGGLIKLVGKEMFL